MIVVWFSCGVASAVAAKLTIEKYSTQEVRVVNSPVIEEDLDNVRFLNDVEKWLGVEIEQAMKICRLADVPYTIVSLGTILGNSALLDSSIDISSVHTDNDELPASFVPGRNMLFLTIACIKAYNLGIQNVVTGVCQTDYSGYPDCLEIS